MIVVRCLKITLLMGLLVLSPVGAALAAPHAGPARVQEEPDDCLFCHSAERLYLTLPSGETLYLTVDALGFAGSAHGQAGLTCVDCHSGYDGYPHPPRLDASLREFQLDHYTLCRDCHMDQYEAQLDSVHQRALAGGREDAAICTDCHGAHEVVSPDEHAASIPQTCSQCHAAITEQYRESVHGAALLEAAHPDVPTCIDCHGVHDIADPLTASFRLASPDICAGCHADPERMAPYGISTAVVETYVADFHGTTTTLFEPRSPEHPPNEALCIDCHGAHDIKEVDDPASPVVRENLLTTCQQCHPAAGEHFPAAWASHYIPSREHNPIVYHVSEFYATLLPTAGVLLGAVITADIVSGLWRLARKWLRGR